jgi:hypothetical protein
MAIFRCIRLAVCACVGILAAATAHADSWSLPKTEIYTSASGAARLTVTPRVPSSQLAYFEDQVRGNRPAGQRPGNRQASARGRLERRGANGRWMPVWEGPLVNEVAPVNALVAGAGEHVVTFDNWHSVGWGDNVVVIYDGAGRVVRSLALSDILPASYIAVLPRSVSSLHWRGEPRISPDGERLILSVVIPGTDLEAETEYVELEVMLADGRPVPPAGPAWERALARAAQAAEAQAAGEERQRAFMTNPLLAPTTTDEGDWYVYLRDAFFRLNWAESMGVSRTVVLRSPLAPDYTLSVPLVRDALRDSHEPGDTLLLGSPDQDNLVTLLTAEVRRLRPGALRGLRLYVVADDARWPRFAAILAPTRAQLVQLDPTEPIPQPAERLRAHLQREEVP